MFLALILIMILGAVGLLTQQQSKISKYQLRKMEAEYAGWSGSQIGLKILRESPDQSTNLAGKLPHNGMDYSLEFINNREGGTVKKAGNINIPPGAVLLKSTGIVQGARKKPQYSLAFEVKPKFEAAAFADNSIQVSNSTVVARENVAWDSNPRSKGRRPILLASRGGSGEAAPATASSTGSATSEPTLGNRAGNSLNSTPASTSSSTAEPTVDSVTTHNNSNANSGSSSSSSSSDSRDSRNNSTNSSSSRGGRRTTPREAKPKMGKKLAAISTNSTDPDGVVLQGGSVIDGDVNLGAGAETKSSLSSRVQGEVRVKDYSKPLAPVTIPSGAKKLNLKPAIGAEVSLNPGVYVVDGDVDLRHVNLKTNGMVKLYIKGDLSADYSTLSPFGGAAENLQIFTVGQHQVTLTGTSGEAALMGDAANYNLNRAELTGAVVGRNVTLQNGTVLQYDERLENLDFESAIEWVQRSVLVGR